MRIVVLPVENDQTEEELTAELVVAIAGEIWRLCGRRGDLDWLEVERMLAEMTAEARMEAAHVVFVGSPEVAQAGAPDGRGSRVRGRWRQPQQAAVGAE